MVELISLLATGVALLGALLLLFDAMHYYHPIAVSAHRGDYGAAAAVSSLATSLRIGALEGESIAVVVDGELVYATAVFARRVGSQVQALEGRHLDSFVGRDAAAEVDRGGDTMVWHGIPCSIVRVETDSRHCALIVTAA